MLRWNSGVFAASSGSRDGGTHDLPLQCDQGDTFACPPTPDWCCTYSDDGHSFQERYEGVIFEAPGSYDFDESYSSFGEGLANSDRVEDNVTEIQKEEEDHYRYQSDRQKISNCNGLSRYFSADDDYKNIYSDAIADEETSDEEFHYDDDSISRQCPKYCSTSREKPREGYKLNNHGSLPAQKDALLITPERRDELRVVLYKKWKHDRLKFDMQPHELALAVTRIKIKWLGEDAALIGTLASEKVKRNTSEAYYKRYRLAAARYRSKLSMARKKINEEFADLREEDKAIMLCKAVGTLKSRTYDHLSNEEKVKITSRQARSIKNALQAGKELNKIACKRMRVPKFDLEELSISQLEVYSRQLIVPNLDAKSSTKALKGFLKMYLGKSDADLEQFSIERHMHYIDLHDNAKREKSIKQKSVLAGRS